MTIPFDIEFPLEWRVSFENRNGTAAQGVSPTLGSGDVGAIAMVRVFDRKGTAELAHVANSIVSEMTKHYKRFILLEQTKLQLGKSSVCRLKYTSDSPAMMGPFRHVDYLILTDNRGYLLMTGAPEKDFQKYDDELGSIVRSFKLKGSGDNELAPAAEFPNELHN